MKNESFDDDFFYFDRKNATLSKKLKKTTTNTCYL